MARVLPGGLLKTKDRSVNLAAIRYCKEIRSRCDATFREGHRDGFGRMGQKGSY